jgi:hypothetical protein
MTFYLFTSTIVAFVVWLNVSDARRQRAMTPAQRRAEDDYLESNSVW